ncbi:MAG TPA: hypothetical protein VIC08_12100 [Cellvibrionaceae bacterium]
MSTATTPPIAELIPHRAPMVLVDSITHWDDKNIICHSESHLSSDNPLRDQGVLSVFAGVEYAAQAMAAHARLISPPKADGPPRKGFLAVASKLTATVAELDTVAAPLVINAHMLAHNADSSLYEFTLHAADTLVLSGQLTAVMTEPEATPA